MTNKNNHDGEGNTSHHIQQRPIVNSIKQSLQKIFPDLGVDNKSLDHPSGKNYNIAAKFLTGTLAFYTTSFFSQLLQYKVFKMSTGTRPAVLPIMMGGATVMVGSAVGHLSGVGVQACWNREGVNDVGRLRMGIEAMRKSVVGMKYIFEREDTLTRAEKRERREVWFHFAGVCILGLLTYKTILRSHFTSLSPSSYTARGSFARIGIPAPSNFNYATSSQRSQLERIGRTWGCHTCGSRMFFSNLSKRDWNKPRFHGDHIPPVSVAKQLNERWYRKKFGWKVSQKFYPQCRDCSNKQGGLLSKAIHAGHRNLRSVGGGEESYFHGGRLRIGHLTGGVVAVSTVGLGTEPGVVEDSRQHVRALWVSVVNAAKDLSDRVWSW
ncbi:hypothetical protein HJC23_004722 [Cyclotella cryptica]|uniref:Uncharacterized protein n=1 Tax=Cyclotella cryptica TaxID=29204 RepID=A0ABD3PU76_9STRA